MAEALYPGALTQTRHEYLARCDAVLAGAPACNQKGPDKARCVLPPGHPGTWHEGDGFDAWGPKYRLWEARGHETRSS